MITALASLPRVGMLLSRVRVEEKLLLAELERRHITVETIDDRTLVLDLARPRREWDVVLARSVSHSRTLYALRVLEGWGVPTVNRHAVVPGRAPGRGRRSSPCGCYGARARPATTSPPRAHARAACPRAAQEPVQ